MPYFGIIEDTKLDQVPGTVLLDQLTAHSEDVTGRLKHGTGRNAHIVLVPQPSEDPNDPLNWSTYKKAAAMYSEFPSKLESDLINSVGISETFSRGPICRTCLCQTASYIILIDIY